MNLFCITLFLCAIVCTIFFLLALHWREKAKDSKKEIADLKAEKSKLSNKVREMGNIIVPLRNKIKRLENKPPIRNKHFIRR